VTAHRLRRPFLAAALVMLSGVAAPAQLLPQTPAEPPAKLEIQAKPIEAFDPREPQRRQFGNLVFRGGLELSSSHKQFGGLSGIRVSADGKFLAITDKAHWLRGRIVYRGDVPAGIADAEVAPMLYADGRPITARGWYDTEAFAEDGGIVYVALERVHRILKFDYGKRGLLARATLVPVPPELGKLSSNKGVECLVVAPKGSPVAGALIAVSERGPAAGKNIRAFLIGGPKPGFFSVKPSDDFDVVDCALTPNSDFLILERHFSWRRGVAMRIRRVAASEVVPGAVLEGSILISADMGFQIDNMEGLSVHRAATGETVLTLVSDDNFSIIQRTILLQFTLLE
jgi:hypothetical protein